MAGKPVQDTRKFKNLLALLNNDEAGAVKAWNALHPQNPVTTATPTAPVAAKPAKKAAAKKTARKTTKAAKPVVKTEGELTSQDKADILVAQAGLTFVRGRVYTNPDVIEAQVRVLKTGTPELIRLDGQHHTKAVSLFRTAEGTVAIQNLGEPS